MGRNERKRRELIGDASCLQVSWLRAAGMATDTIVLGGALLVALVVILSVATVWHVSEGMLLLSTSAIVVFSQLARPAYWKRVREIHAERTPVLPDALEVRDPMVGALVQRLGRARQIRQRATAQSPYGAHHALSASAGDISELERRAVVIAARAELVSSFVAEASDSCLSTESGEAIARLEERRAALVETLEHLTGVLEAIPAKAMDVELRRLDEGDQLIGADSAEAELALSHLDQV